MDIDESRIIEIFFSHEEMDNLQKIRRVKKGCVESIVEGYMQKGICNDEIELDLLNYMSITFSSEEMRSIEKICEAKGTDINGLLSEYLAKGISKDLPTETQFGHFV